MIMLIIFLIMCAAFVCGAFLCVSGFCCNDNSEMVIGGIIAVVFALLIVLMTLFVTVPAGHVGVKDTFGNVDNSIMVPGFHFKGNPFMNVVSMNTQTKKISEHYTTLTNEGLDVGIDMTLNYKLNPDKAVDIYKTVGIKYEDVIVKPQVRSAVRNIVADYDAKQIYSTDRSSIAIKIENEITPTLLERGIIVEDVVISKADLPSKIKEAIEQKLEAEQLISKKEFDVKTAEMEAKRKIAEARGIADSQEIIDGSLTPGYLKWYWISSLDNNKNVIYVPIGVDGMPIMKTV